MSSRIQNGLDQDFLIISGEWHDDLHYPTRDGQPGGVFVGLGNHFPPIDNEIFYLDLFGFELTEAEMSEIEEVVGKSRASIIYDYFHGENPT